MQSMKYKIHFVVRSVPKIRMKAICILLINAPCLINSGAHTTSNYYFWNLKNIVSHATSQSNKALIRKKYLDHAT